MGTSGVIGLGRMGGAIAQRLTGQGLDVLGWTRSGRKVDGVPASPDLATLVRTCDTLILSLLNDDAVAATLDRLLALDLSGKLIIDTSTVTPGVLLDRIDALQAAGADAVDAPISGGPELVLAGRCSVFIGGGTETATQALERLAPLTDRLFHVGPTGCGLVMKVINNGMLQTYFAGLAELLPLARKAGLPFDTAMRILAGGPAGTPMVLDRLPKILGEDTTVGFDITAVFKDNAIFRNVLESYGLSAVTLDRFAGQKSAVDKAGIADQDIAALIRLAYDDAEQV